jgi:hypothetical protein
MASMQSMSAMTQSVALIGKQIDYLDAGGAPQTGTVKSVSTVGGFPTLVLADDTRVTPADVIMVK